MKNSLRSDKIFAKLILVTFFLQGSFLYGSIAHSRELNLPFGNLAPFESDGCTFFPDGNDRSSTLWLHCCQKHDLLYWVGGSEKARLAADEGLKECVTNVGEFETANFMYEGVRIGGSPFINTSWRWGFGWSEMRGYTPLNRDERFLVKRRLRGQ